MRRETSPNGRHSCSLQSSIFPDNLVEAIVAKPTKPCTQGFKFRWRPCCSARKQSWKLRIFQYLASKGAGKQSSLPTACYFAYHVCVKKSELQSLSLGGMTCKAARLTSNQKRLNTEREAEYLVASAKAVPK